jgi:formiminoglutamase
MPRISPPEASLRDVTPNDQRVGHLLGTSLGPGATPRAVLLGFPSDIGVRRNGGRAGAAEGADALRKALYRLTPDPRCPRFDDLLRHTRDLGNLETTSDLEADQRALGEVLAPLLQSAVFVIVLGGGHETSYGHFLAYARIERPVSILNWDAHADVRELKEGQGHSGSPFRQALEDRSGACLRYTVAGLQPQAVARGHLEFVKRHGTAVWRDEVSRDRIPQLYQSAEGATLVSFDLDAVSQAEAPGVSAPSPAGISAELWLEAAYLAGRSPVVSSVDVVELNPGVDRDGQTARLAAVTVWQVLRGLADRG